MNKFNSGAFLVLIALFFSFAQAQNQDLDFTWGQDIDAETEIVKIIHRDANGHYALTNRRKTFFIEYFSNPDYKRKFTTELKLPEINDRRMDLENVYYMDGNLLLFSSYYDRKTKTQNTYAFKLDERGKIVSKRIDIFSINVEAKWKSGETKIKISRDNSKMLAIHSAPFTKSEKAWVINMKILTPELDMIKEMTEKIPLEQEEDYVEISNAIISNDAGVYVAARQLSWVRKLRLNVTKSMTIYSYDPSNGFEVVIIPVEISKNKSASSIVLEIDTDGNLLGAGFYGEYNRQGIFKFEAIKGTYFIKIDRITESVAIKNLEPFAGDFYKQVLSDRALKKGRDIANVYIPRKIVMKEDGGVVLIAEYYTYSQSTNNGVQTTTIIHGPLIVANITSVGEIDWVKVVPKYQMFSESKRGLNLGIITLYSSNAYKVTQYHSFLVGVGESSLYFIYNDHPKNVSMARMSYKEGFRSLNGFKGAVPVCVTIDENGKMNKEILQAKDRSEVKLRPKISFQNDYGEVLVYGSRRNKDKFGLLKY